MVFAFESDEARVWNQGCQFASCVKRHHRIVSGLQDEGWNSQRCGEVYHVQLGERAAKPHGRFRRRRC